MAIKLYRNRFPLSVFDDLAIFDNWLSPFTTTFTAKGQWVNTDLYDIVPKSSYKKELLEQTQKQIDELEEQKRMLTDELKKLKG